MRTFFVSTFMSLAIRLGSILVFSFLCFSAWAKQEVYGSSYKYEIPESPVGSETALKWALSHREYSGPNANQEYRDSAFKKCPKISALVFSIFDRIVLYNHLESFAEGPIGLRISMNCLGVLPTGTGAGNGAIETGAIIINSSLITTAKTEDEVAFILSHEIAHLLLAHPQLKFDWVNSGAVVQDPTFAQEEAADRLGAIISANAGYNVRESGALALWHGMQFYTESYLIKYSPIVILSTGEGSTHGSIGQRKTRIIDAANKANIVNDRVPRVSPYLEEALLEFNKIKSSLKK